MIGAGWLDLGAEPTRAAVLEAFAPALDAATPGSRDAEDRPPGAGGPRAAVPPWPTRSPPPPGRPSDPRFTSRVRVGGEVMGRGHRPLQAGVRAGRRRARPSPGSRPAPDAEPPHRCAGFKSFADATSLELGPGVNVVVGPQRVGQEQPGRGGGLGPRRAAGGPPARRRHGRRPVLRRGAAAGGAVRRGRPGAVRRGRRPRRPRRGGGQPPPDPRGRRRLPPQLGVVPPAGRAGGPRLARRRAPTPWR